jgi:hypothetical protein
MIVLIGIDDTDNKESRGTGFQARQMAAMLASEGLAKITGITRHQHFVHPDIPYTSQNSSACIEAEITDRQAVWDVCSQHLVVSAAPGSDAGLAIARIQEISTAHQDWAWSTKTRVVKMEDAYAIAAQEHVWLEGFTGNHQGIIGALAAVALRNGGNDGRFIATAGNFHLRSLPEGAYQALELLKITNADRIVDLEFNQIPDEDSIYVNSYLRPVLRDKKCTILVTKSETAYDWESAGKDILRSY